jgi:hypothetical protein
MMSTPPEPRSSPAQMTRMKTMMVVEDVCIRGAEAPRCGPHGTSPLSHKETTGASDYSCTNMHVYLLGSNEAVDPNLTCCPCLKLEVSSKLLASQH